MFYAKDEQGNYVFANAQCVNSRVYCPDCNSEMRIKRSNKGRYFFVHMKRCGHNGGEGDSHMFWKKYIYDHLKARGARQEVALNNQRRADVLIGKTIIEIQFSNISVQRLKERITDYRMFDFCQYWIFKFPPASIRYLTLTPMAMHVWKDTEFPLLYIHFQTKQLLHIQEIQVLSRNKALYKAIPISLSKLLTLKREHTLSRNIQQQWLLERERQLTMFYQRHIQHPTILAKQLYYLKEFGYEIEHFGVAYTGNGLFIVSPFVWQVQLVYMKVIQEYTLSMCCEELMKMTVLIEHQIIERVVVQALEQFLALPVDARCQTVLTKK